MLKNVYIILAFLIFEPFNVKADVSVWDGQSYSLDWYTSDSDSIYYIKTAADLAGLSYCFSTGYYLRGKFVGKTVMLDNDIDLAGHEWTPIGVLDSNNFYYEFAGTFDGNYHIIKGLSINHLNSKCIGLFGINWSKSFTVKNLRVEGSIMLNDITDDIDVGGVVGFSCGGSIENCQSCVNISIVKKSGHYVTCGGIVGWQSSSTTIKKCSSRGDISLNNNGSHAHVGGIIGDLRSDSGNTILSSCVSQSNITITNCNFSSNIGGIVGYAYENTILENVLYSGTIDLINPDDYCYVGGMMGDGSTYFKCCLMIGNFITGKMPPNPGFTRFSPFSGVSYDDTTGEYCYYLSGTQNYYDFGTEMSESELKSGNPIYGFDTSIWDFQKGCFPTLQFLKTYTLSITARGNGSVSYFGSTIRNKIGSFTVNNGTNATMTFIPDNGYRIKSVKLDGTDVTMSVSNNSYSIIVKRDANVEVEFELIPIPTYTLTITANGNGAVSYNGNTIRSKSEAFTVNEGTTANLVFSPDNGYYTKSVKVNGADVTESVVDDKYAISSMMANTSVEVEFAEELKAFASEGVNYIVTSFKGKTIVVTKGDYGKVVTVPATVNYQDEDWTVVGIEADALTDDSQLAAIIWNAKASFTATTSNPNLLLYVTDSSYAPSTVNNVVVNGTAESIILAEADSGNNFYCPQEFTARSISYAHNYTMTTGIGEARGWETLALPFDVQQVKHENKGELTPFANWKSGNEEKPFWLMELSSSGWRETDRIMANTPYIVSMPNNEKYKEEFLLNGKVTFSAENATVRKSEDVKNVQYEGRTFIPTFSEIGEGDGAYALNVSNDYETNVSGVADGSRFVLNLRRIHPFEAYMQSSAKTRAFDISDGMGIVTNNEKLMIKVYNLKGQMLKHQEGTEEDIKKHLPKGLYIINGKKIIVR